MNPRPSLSQDAKILGTKPFFLGMQVPLGKPETQNAKPLTNQSASARQQGKTIWVVLTTGAFAGPFRIVRGSWGPCYIVQHGYFGANPWIPTRRHCYILLRGRDVSKQPLQLDKLLTRTHLLSLIMYCAFDILDL